MVCNCEIKIAPLRLRIQQLEKTEAEQTEIIKKLSDRIFPEEKLAHIDQRLIDDDKVVK